MDALSSARRQSLNVDGPAAPDASCVNALPSGTRLQGFEILSPLGQGGFSIVYAAMDTTLQRPVAVKEYMPGSFASRADSSKVILRSQRHKTSFDAGLNSFIEEARLLAQFKHPALVEVLSFWEENGTAYMAMPLYGGKTLRQTLRDHPRCANEALLKGWIAPVLDVLEMLHEQQVFHRDIAPDNIIIQPDGSPVLLDLGSARRVVTDSEHAPTVVVKAGYAPIEQYAEDKSVPQGPWTDIYALGALLYYAITGRAPSASVSRMMKDSLVLLSDQPLPGYSNGFLAAIDHALALQPGDRPQSISELRDALDIHDRTTSQATRMSPAKAGATAPDYDDEEKTVILSAEELELLLNGGTKPEAPDPSDEYQHLFDSQPDPVTEPHAFADMEEFLNPSPPQSLGRMSVPGSQAHSTGDVAFAASTEPAEGIGGNRIDRRLIWMTGVAAASLLVVLFTASVLLGQSEEAAPQVADADHREPAPAAVRSAPSIERAAPHAVDRLGDAGTNPFFNVPRTVPNTNRPEAPAGRLLLDTPLHAQSDGTASSPDGVAPLLQIETGSSVLRPLPEIVTVELDVDPSEQQAVSNPPVAQPQPRQAPASTPAAVTSRAQPSAPVSRPVRAPATGKVALNILPWGEVWVDGAMKGVTPPLRTLDLPVGRRSIEIRNPGFPSLTHSIEVSAGKTPEIVHEFISGSSRRDLDTPAQTTPAAPAVQRERVAEQSRPAPRRPAPAARTQPAVFGYTDIRVRPWAEVWVNGEKKGVAPPLKELRLTEGLHTIEFRNPDYPTASRAVQISSAARSTLVQFFD